MWATLLAWLIPRTQQAISRTISVVSVLLVVAGLVWAIYAGVIRPVTKPNPTNVQRGGISYNVDYHPTFGCMRLPQAVERTPVKK